MTVWPAMSARLPARTAPRTRARVHHVHALPGAREEQGLVLLVPAEQVVQVVRRPEDLLDDAPAGRRTGGAPHLQAIARAGLFAGGDRTHHVGVLLRSGQDGTPATLRRADLAAIGTAPADRTSADRWKAAVS